MQFAWLIISLAAGTTFNPYLTNHSEAINNNWGRNHVRIMTDDYWRECFDDKSIAVKIKHNKMTVQQSGMKMYAQTGGWLELKNNVKLPSHCDLIAVPVDVTPIGTLVDNIEALKEQRKPFAIARLYGGDQLVIKIQSFGELQESSSTSISALPLLIGFVSLVLIILIRQ